MPVLLQRLQSLLGDTLESSETNQIIWDKLSGKKDKIQELILIHPLLEIEYSVHCTHLVHNFTRVMEKIEENRLSQKEFQTISKNLTEQLTAALAMSELLEHIYHDFLDVPYEVSKLQKEQDYYRALLGGLKTDFFIPNTSVAPTKAIREITVNLNWTRLFTFRIRRVFITLLPFVENWELFTSNVKFIDQFLGPAVKYIACLFYLPRLAVNLFLVLKHLFPNDFLEKGAKEEELDWDIRLKAQFQRRWFFLGNDASSCIGGFLGCFLLVGALASAGAYLGVAIFFLDVILASIRAYIEISKMEQLREIYRNLAQEREAANAPSMELDEIYAYQERLEEQFDWKQKELIVAILANSALFLAMILTIPPLVAIGPVISLISAVLVLIITLASFLANRWIDSHSPSNELKIKSQAEFLFKNPHVLFQTTKIESEAEKEPFAFSSRMILSHPVLPHDG